MFFEHFNCAFRDKLKGTNHFKANYFGITRKYCLKSVEVKGLTLAPDEYEWLCLGCVTLSHKVSLTHWVGTRATLCGSGE
jgi:hypothetical protein